MRNITLIGMPGAGKSTVGVVLAKLLGLDFIDSDLLIQAREGRLLWQIIDSEGIEGFWRVEERVNASIEADGAVIATGGGIILRPENMAALGETGVVFFLDRPPEDIAGEDHGGRPLIGSDRERVFQLYTQRIHLYRKYGAYTISNPKTPEEAAERIAALYRKECQP